MSIMILKELHVDLLKKDQYLPSHRTSFGDLTMIKLTLSSRSIHKLKLDFYYTL